MLKRKFRKLMRSVKAKAEAGLEWGDRLAASLRRQPTLVPIPIRVRNRDRR
jgi:hypothetical protein